MNLPGDLVHSVEIGFARLIMPVANGAWLVWARGLVDKETGRVIAEPGLGIVDRGTFHNCRRDGM